MDNTAHLESLFLLFYIEPPVRSMILIDIMMQLKPLFLIETAHLKCEKCNTIVVQVESKRMSGLK